METPASCEARTAPSSYPATPGVGEAAEEFVIGDGLVAFRTDESNTANGEACSAECTAARCPLGMGYWKNHPTAWPLFSMLLGLEIYSRSELLVMLGTPTGSRQGADVSVTLADQLIAAKLNIARGADARPIYATIASADAQLAAFRGKLPYRVRPSSSAGRAMTAAASVLATYNGGGLTPCVP